MRIAKGSMPTAKGSMPTAKGSVSAAKPAVSTAKPATVSAAYSARHRGRRGCKRDRKTGCAYRSQFRHDCFS
jgi:hypothetical protein